MNAEKAARQGVSTHPASMVISVFFADGAGPFDKSDAHHGADDGRRGRYGNAPQGEQMHADSRGRLGYKCPPDIQGGDLLADGFHHMLALKHGSQNSEYGRQQHGPPKRQQYRPNGRTNAIGRIISPDIPADIRTGR